MLNAFLKKIRHFDVAGQRYTIEEEIGEGAFAYVYRVKDKTGTCFALKKMICQTDDQLAEARKEIKILSEMHHENILPIHAQSIEINKAGQHEAHLLLPLYERSLQIVIDRGPGFPFGAVSSPKIAVKILRGCVSGVEALHASGYRHGDFKPANILLNSDWRPVLTDFGSVEPLRVEVTNRSQALAIQECAAINTTASFRAPELFDTPSNCVIDGKTDVWGLGCTVYAMLFSRTPFENPIDGLSTLAVLSGRFSIPSSSEWAPEWHTMIQACLRVDIETRLSIQDLKLVASLLSEDAFVPVIPAATSGEVSGSVITGAATGEQSEAESFADFAHFPVKGEGPSEHSKQSTAKKSGGHTQNSHPSVTTTTTAFVTSSTYVAPALLSTVRPAGSSRRVSFGDWQTAAPATSGCVSDARGEEDEGQEGEDYEFGEFVEATGDLTVATPSATASSPSKEKSKSSPQKRVEGGFGGGLVSDSSKSSLGGSSVRSDVSRSVVTKSGAVYVIRPRRSGLGKKNVKKQVWLRLCGPRLLLQKSNDRKSKVHMDVLLAPTSSVRSTSSMELSPHSAVLEGLLENSSSSRGEGSSSGDPDTSRDSDVNDFWSGGGSISVEVGFETRADMESWVAILQGEIDSLAT